MNNNKFKMLLNEWQFKNPQKPRTIKEFAKIMKVTSATVHEWCNGGFPSKRHNKICEELNINKEQLHEILGHYMIFKKDKDTDKVLGKYSNIREAAKSVDGNIMSLRMTLKGATKTYKGYKWERIEF